MPRRHLHGEDIQGGQEFPGQLLVYTSLGVSNAMAPCGVMLWVARRAVSNLSPFGRGHPDPDERQQCSHSLQGV
jgi:hypothetical protein